MNKTLVLENVVERFRGPPYPYYHRRPKRVPTIDECDVEDIVCQYEADVQFRTDMLVDMNIVRLLRARLTECSAYYGVDAYKMCKKIRDDFQIAETNYFVKYGDIKPPYHAVEAYMKQKHRMIWQRRHPEHDLIGLSKREKLEKERISKMSDATRRKLGIDFAYENDDDNKTE